MEYMEGKGISVSLENVFLIQKRAWEELQKIPRGETRSYAKIAKAIGKLSGSCNPLSSCYQQQWTSKRI